MSKRKRPETKSKTTGLNKEEETIFKLIRSKEGMGATKSDINGETGIQPAIATRAIASLKKSNVIKEVANMNNKGFKHFLAMDFEPDKSLTGGDWYTDGALDVSRIEDLKEKCLKILERYKDKAMTLELFGKSFEKMNLDRGLVKDILKNLVLDNLVMEVKSTGLDEFSETRIGEICYKLTGKKSGNGEARVGAFASVPCGVCPHIALCSPGGVISPTTCSYFQKWLDF